MGGKRYISPGYSPNNFSGGAIGQGMSSLIYGFKDCIRDNFYKGVFWAGSKKWPCLVILVITLGKPRRVELFCRLGCTDAAKNFTSVLLSPLFARLQSALYWKFALYHNLNITFGGARSNIWNATHAADVDPKL